MNDLSGPNHWAKKILDAAADDESRFIKERDEARRMVVDLFVDKYLGAADFEKMITWKEWEYI